MDDFLKFSNIYVNKLNKSINTINVVNCYIIVCMRFILITPIITFIHMREHLLHSDYIKS